MRSSGVHLCDPGSGEPDELDLSGLIADLIQRVSVDSNITEIANDLYYALMAEMEVVMNHSNPIGSSNPGSQNMISP